jgi:hypothetical protein
MQRTMRLLSSVPVVWDFLDGEERRRWVAKVVYDQLKFIMIREIVRLELEILSEIDRIAHGGIGKQGPIGAWAALWILMLSYQGHMIAESFHKSYGKSKNSAGNRFKPQLNIRSAQRDICSHPTHIQQPDLDLQRTLQDHIPANP